jgi:hypothetical protein
MVLIGLIWLRIETSGGSCEHGNEPSGSIKCWKFLSTCRIGGSLKGLSSMSKCSTFKGQERLLYFVVLGLPGKEAAKKAAMPRALRTDFPSLLFANSSACRTNGLLHNGENMEL